MRIDQAVGAGAARVSAACLRVVAVVVVCVGVLLVPSVAWSDFGFVPGSLSMVARNADGTVDRQAGSHPYSFEVTFELKTGPGGETEGGEARDFIVDLPPGFLGNPQAVPRCPRSQFEGILPVCSVGTQIGVLEPTIKGGVTVKGPVYNMEPPAGVAAQLGFSAASFNALQNASIRTEEGYGAQLTAKLPIEVRRVHVTVWGVPADSSHDPERGGSAGIHGEDEKSSAPLLPFLTMPTTCGTVPTITVRADSKLAPGVFTEISAPALDAGGNPAPMIGCEAVPFSPLVSSQPTTRLADNSTGLDFGLELQDQGWLVPNGVAETQPERIEVTLPEGITANPSVANGIATCSEAQYRAQGPASARGEGCPEASKLGSIIAHSPLINEPIEGSLYLATPYQNPTGSLIGVYVVAKAGERGVMIKQAGKVEPNPVTGQLVSTFEGLPPLAYEGVALHFREGPRAPLVSPPTCGTYTTTTKLWPFSNPTSPRTLLSNFTIDHGVDGGACPPAGLPPFKPSSVAGMVNNSAGAYSPLYLQVERKDGEQEITGFSTLLPPGLSGNLTGIPFCGEAEIQHARQQTGAEAETNPTCPATSQIGHTVAEAGVGSILAQAPGKLYLAGPFEGAPFSVLDITSAKVGPFDLGTVVVHLPLRVDPITAQVSIPAGPADQIPHIIKGIVVHLRTIRAYIDRQRFTLNPTSCEPMGIVATVVGSGQSFTNPADDVSASTTSRFQAAECAALAFKPSFKASTSAKTSRKLGASLHVTLTYPHGSNANIRSVKVNLPKQLPSRLTTLQQACTAKQFEANPAGCPAASRVGTARAITPILPVPLEGPAYFVSHGGAKFPELIIVLQGYGITIDLHGETFINEHTNVTSSTFHTVPDQPVASFELTLPQGPNSALAAPTGLCDVTTTRTVKKKVTVRGKDGQKRTVTRKVKQTVPTSLVMPTIFTGQNGMTLKQNTPISVSGCPKKKAKTVATARRSKK